MRIGSLFSGAGGLDLAVERVFGGRTVWHCELDSAASKVLAYRWPGVPNLGDITAVDWKRVEWVEILCGGFPCQDISSAGRQAGMGEGTRSGLWSEFLRAVDAIRPLIVVIENVRNLLSVAANRHVESEADDLGDNDAQPVLRGLGAVLGDLSDLGYDAQWVTVSAASVGAPHRRERVFILATDTTRDGWQLVDDSASSSEACGGWERHPAGSAGRTPVPVDLLPTPTPRDFKGGNTTVSDGNGGRRPVSIEDTTRARGDGGASDLATVACLLPTPSAADAECGPDFARATREGSGGDDLVTLCARATRGIGSRWGKYEAAISRWESLTRPAPSPTEPNTKGNPRLAPVFPEWMQGWPGGWATAVPGVSRNDQLRIIGNGVCPQQAMAALWQLIPISVVAE